MDYLICSTCGQQYDTSSIEDLQNKCFICLDERQFVPQSGQKWTTLSRLRKSGQYKNHIKETKSGQLWSLSTVPKFGIGQRAILVKEEGGNVLWDCIAYLDQDTIDFITSLGGLSAICISHPHYYATCIEWAHVFHCQVWIFAEDANWITRPSTSSYNLLKPPTGNNREQSPLHHHRHHHVDVTKSLKMIKIGGHFPGSAVLYSARDGGYILVGDTVSLTPGNRRVTIMWSYPNMIPLDLETISNVCWPRFEALAFDSIYAKFLDEEIVGNAKEIMHDSLSFYCKKLGGVL